MTVEKLIKVLQDNVTDHDRAEIEFWIGEQQYELERIGQFGIIPDVTFTLKAIETPILKPIKHFRRDKEEMVAKTVKKIKQTQTKK